MPEINLNEAKWPNFESDEIDAAIKVLESGKVNQWTGDNVFAFEKEFASYCGTKYCVALANGTVALEMAYKVLQFNSGDEVIVTPRTFVASASSIAMCGLKPVFVDVDRDSQNISPKCIEQAITPKTRAIVTVHLAGWMCEMDQIIDIAKAYNLYIIEDCAQAHGAKYKNRIAGSFGIVSAYSFCQDKIITTAGEGGAFLTNDEELWQKAWSYKDHGKSYQKTVLSKPTHSTRFVHDTFGTNWRLTELQAAVGRVQLKKLDLWVEKRRKNASILTERFLKIPGLRVTIPPAHIYHSYYKYYTFIIPQALKSDWSRDRILDEINSLGVKCFSGSCSEVYLEKCFERVGLQPQSRLPVAKELGETSIMFLVHPTLNDYHMHYVADMVEKVMKQAVK